MDSCLPRVSVHQRKGPSDRWVRLRATIGLQSRRVGLSLSVIPTA